MDHEPRRVTFPKRAWIALGVFGLLQVGLLASQLFGIFNQRQIVRDQLGVARSNAELAQPVLRDTRPLVEAARENLPSLGRAARHASGLVRDTRPLVRRLAPLAEEFTANQAVGAIAAAGQLALDLTDHEAAHAIATTGDLTRELAAGERLVRLVDRSLRLVGDIERAGTVAAVRDMRGVLHQVLSIQRRTLSTQLQSLEVQRSTLAVQQEALRHIRSIDRKTGGELPG